MEVRFKDEALREIYEYGKTSARQYKNVCKNSKLIAGYQRAVRLMFSVDDTACLGNFSYLHYEKLKYQGAEGRSSVRLVNGLVERLIFTEYDNGIIVELIEIDSTHYGNKK